jgi:hypothetical protein
MHQNISVWNCFIRIFLAGQRPRRLATSKQQLLNSGRDHHPQGFCAWLAGGGVKGGVSHGELDELGHEAAVDRHHIRDLHATILHLLGIDHERLTYRYGGRDFRLTDVEGHVVDSIFA